MPVIMKNAVYARKTLAKKARTQALESSRQEKAKTLGNNTITMHSFLHLFPLVVYSLAHI